MFPWLSPAIRGWEAGVSVAGVATGSKRPAPGHAPAVGRFWSAIV